MNTPCCRQGAHCECFRYWAALSTVDGTVHCGYCRTLFPDNQLCFLWLEKKNNNEQLMITNCCHTTMRSVLSGLSFDVVLECGQAAYCECIWTDV